MPRVPRFESTNAQLPEGLASFVRKPRRRQLGARALPYEQTSHMKYQEINYPTRLTYEGYGPPPEQFNFHAAVTSKSTPAIQTGDTSGATSIHELLHGSSLLNLENLLKAPGSFVLVMMN